MAFDNEISTVIDDIRKNSRGDYIRITKITDKDSSELLGVDIRQYYTGDDDELYPTKKGLRIKTKNLKSVIDSLNQIVEEMFNE